MVGAAGRTSHCIGTRRKGRRGRESALCPASLGTPGLDTRGFLFAVKTKCVVTKFVKTGKEEAPVIAGRGSVGIEAVVLLIPVVAERGVLRLTGWKGMNRVDGSTLVRHRRRVNT